jgi:hypothetical protein
MNNIVSVILHNITSKLDACIIMPNNLFCHQYNCCDRFDAAHLDKVFTRLTQKSDEDTFILWAPDTPRHSLSPMLLCQVDSTYSDIGIYTTASGSL